MADLFDDDETYDVGSHQYGDNGVYSPQQYGDNGVYSPHQYGDNEVGSSQQFSDNGVDPSQPFDDEIDLSQLSIQDDGTQDESVIRMILQMQRKYPPRQDQIDSFKRAINNNLILHMPTGKGKTLVAVLLIEYFLNIKPYHRIIFTAPTGALVSQQANYCRENCLGGVIVQELIGGSVDGWNEEKWQNVLNESHILVGTPEIFRRVFNDKGFFAPHQFSLIVIDECHNVTGNAPGVHVINTINNAPEEHRPRILGLTASFVNGNISSAPEKRKEMEGLFRATIYVPLNLEHRRAKYHAVKDWDYSDDNPHVNDLMSEILLPLEEYCKPKDYDTIVRTCKHLYKNLGASALTYYLSEALIPQTEMVLRGYDQNKYQKFRQNIEQIKKSISEFAQVLKEISFSESPNITNKMYRLLLLLDELKREYAANSIHFRGIVFVKQVAVTFPMTFLINDFFAKGNSTKTRPHATDISGGASMSNATRETNLQDFRDGKIPILVATNVAEEGLDIPECSFVIRYDKFDTTKAHIQGSGRARYEKAEMYYFENDPNEEEKKSQILVNVATNSIFATSKTEKDKIGESMKLIYHEKHPYVHRSSSGESLGEITVFNCMQILNEYVQKVTRLPISPEKHLFIYESNFGSKILTQVQVPTPNGIIHINIENVEQYWGDVILQTIVPENLTANLRISQLEIRRFVFVVVVRLVELGHIGPGNVPSETAISGTAKKCNAILQSGETNGISVKPKFSTNSDRTIFSPLSAQFRKSQSTQLVQISQSSLSDLRDDSQSQINWKGKLQESLHKKFNHCSAEALTKYECTSLIGNPPKFACMLTILPLNYQFTGDCIYNSKKDAEKVAAELAFIYLTKEKLIY